MDEVYEKIDEYNPSKKREILIAFDDMIADIMTNKKFQAIIIELFIRWWKLNTSLTFITQSYFSVPKYVRLNSTHYFIMKIKNRKELQNVAINHSVDTDYKDCCEDLQRMHKKNRILFWQLILASDPLKISKKWFCSYQKDSSWSG